MTDDARRLRRTLNSDELALWKTVTRSVKAFRTDLINEPERQDRARRESGHRIAPSNCEKAQLPRLSAFEPRLRRRLARGQDEVDAVLDLHGLNQAEAHSQLSEFIVRLQSMGARTVLIVTGKGKGDGSFSGGVLYRNAPLWLQSPAMRRFVSSIVRADRNHGGDGALYVRLRRRTAHAS